MSELFDLIIVGAGPAGLTLALNLAETGMKIGILEKDIFPRKKICGDALSGKVLNILKRLPEPAYHNFLLEVPKIPSQGICFTAPNGLKLDLPFYSSGESQKEAAGFICPREEFDHFLLKQVKRYPNIKVFEGIKVTNVTTNEKNASIQTDKGQFLSKVVVGADGVHSKVRSLLSSRKISKTHFCLGIRQYYEQVKDLHQDNFIELIFLKELLPGYLWIFPGPDGRSNVGLGMLQSQVSRKKINVSLLLHHLLSTHPLLKSRFSSAIPIGKAEAHSLPLGPLNMPLSGNRFLLTGDAAFLVDPFSGEGIGNAMASAEVAARILKKAFLGDEIHPEILKEYDLGIQKRMGNELKTSAMVQRLAHSPWLFNFVMNKAGRNNNLREIFREMYINAETKKKLTRPGFYLGLLLR